MKEEKEPAAKRSGQNRMGVGIALGCGIGAALGVALGSIPIWLAIGAGVGVAIGVAMSGSPSPPVDSTDGS
jgi:hypothetical protein